MMEGLTEVDVGGVSGGKVGRGMKGSSHIGKGMLISRAMKGKAKEAGLQGLALALLILQSQSAR